MLSFNVSKEDKRKFLELYFYREKGIGYNFGRSHINSCDFSIGIYSSVEEGDKTLETFNLDRKKKYILPFLNDVLECCDEEIVLFASPWCPPAYMTDNKDVLPTDFRVKFLEFNMFGIRFVTNF